MRLALAALLLAACTPSAPERSEHGVLEDALRQASLETGVPRDLLAAIAYSETRLDGRGGAPDLTGRVGVMGLRTDGGEPSLGHASRELGLSQGAVEHDVSNQVLGAAWILHDWAEEEWGSPPEEVEAWWPMLERWSGAEQAVVADGYAVQVYRLLEQGFIHRTPEGERIEVRPRPVDLSPLGWRAAGTDSPVADAWVPACSSNYTAASRTSGDIDTVVLHVVQGSYSSAVSWFSNCAAHASAHYVVRSSDGEITQQVREEDIAWHAGNWDVNAHAIGVEHEGYIDSPGWFSDAMYRESAALVRDICDRNGIPKDRDHIIGHAEVPDPDGSGYGGASHHTDPGSLWDWGRFMTLVQSGSSTSPVAHTGDLTGYLTDSVWGGSVAGATVCLDTGACTTSDGAGRYTFSSLDEGWYTLRASASGYEAESTDRWVAADTTTWASMALVPAGGGASSPSSGYAAPEQPSGLSPARGADVWTSSVDLSWSDGSIPASWHEVELWWWDGSDWQWYYTWETTARSKQVWPVVHDATYAWTVRSSNDAGWGPWSEWAYFQLH